MVDLVNLGLRAISMLQGGRAAAPPTITAIIRILPCTTPTDYNKTKVALLAWAQRGCAQTRF